MVRSFQKEERKQRKKEKNEKKERKERKKEKNERKERKKARRRGKRSLHFLYTQTPDRPPKAAAMLLMTSVIVFSFWMWGSPKSVLGKFLGVTLAKE